jgi:hypothetical protein
MAEISILDSDFPKDEYINKRIIKDIVSSIDYEKERNEKYQGCTRIPVVRMWQRLLFQFTFWFLTRALWIAKESY